MLPGLQDGDERHLSDFYRLKTFQYRQLKPKRHLLCCWPSFPRMKGVHACRLISPRWDIDTKSAPALLLALVLQDGGERNLCTNRY